MMASLTHFHSRLWAWQATSTVSARPVSGFWSSGELLIFFVFTLTFEAKRRKLIEGLISTQSATNTDTITNNTNTQKDTGDWSQIPGKNETASTWRMINKLLPCGKACLLPRFFSFPLAYFYVFSFFVAICVLCTNYGHQWRWRLSIFAARALCFYTENFHLKCFVGCENNGTTRSPSCTIRFTPFGCPFPVLLRYCGNIAVGCHLMCFAY